MNQIPEGVTSWEELLTATRAFQVEVASSSVAAGYRLWLNNTTLNTLILAGVDKNISLELLCSQDPVIKEGKAEYSRLRTWNRDWINKAKKAYEKEVIDQGIKVMYHRWILQWLADNVLDQIHWKIFVELYEGYLESCKQWETVSKAVQMMFNNAPVDLLLAAALPLNIQGDSDLIAQRLMQYWMVKPLPTAQWMTALALRLQLGKPIITEKGWGRIFHRDEGEVI
jgi:hypothetical protein